MASKRIRQGHAEQDAMLAEYDQKARLRQKLAILAIEDDREIAAGRPTTKALLRKYHHEYMEDILAKMRFIGRLYADSVKDQDYIKEQHLPLDLTVKFTAAANDMKWPNHEFNINPRIRVLYSTNTQRAFVADGEYMMEIY